MKNSNCVIAALLVAMFFTACGDSDGASANSGSATLEEVYASEDDLPGCTEKYEGAVAFVKDGSAAFKCEDGRWENKGEYYANNDAIKNCTEKREGEVAYIVDEDKSLVCQDGKWMKAEKQKESSSSTKTTEPAEGSSTSKVSSSSSWNEVTGSSSSSSRNDAQYESSSESKVSEPAEGLSSSIDSPESNGSAQTLSSSSAEESSSSVVSSSSFIGCKTAEVDNCEYGEILDERDGKKYKTVKIGDQWWMAENLNFEYKIYDEKTEDSVSYGNFCNKDECKIFSRFYNWGAAMDSAGVFSDNGKGCGARRMCTITYPVRGVCPNGWHLPDTTEWKNLYNTIGNSPNAMQARNYEVWTNANDAFGLSIIPSGYYFYANPPMDCLMCAKAYFWSANEYDIKRAFYWTLTASGFDLNNDEGAALNKLGTSLSVRCVKD